MRKSKIFEWLALLLTALLLLFAGLGLLILGNEGVSSIIPHLNATQSIEGPVSWLYSATYWFIYCAGVILFFVSFVIIARLISKIFKNERKAR